MHGKFQDSTPFQFSEKHRAADYFGEQLAAAGYNYHGSESLYSGLSGVQMQADIFIGVVYYQRLRHMVSDKSQVRATGPNNVLTRQPIKGRKKHGGIRFGEMERDSLLAHGASFLLQDRLMNCSDKHLAWVCSKCGSMLSPVTAKSDVDTSGVGFSSGGAGGEMGKRVVCQNCTGGGCGGTGGVGGENETKVAGGGGGGDGGREGGECVQVAMPYVFRYLANELAAMNIRLSLSVK